MQLDVRVQDWIASKVENYTNPEWLEKKANKDPDKANRIAVSIFQLSRYCSNGYPTFTKILEASKKAGLFDRQNSAYFNQYWLVPIRNCFRLRPFHLCRVLMKNEEKSDLAQKACHSMRDMRLDTPIIDLIYLNEEDTVSTGSVPTLQMCKLKSIQAINLIDKACRKGHDDMTLYLIQKSKEIHESLFYDVLKMRLPKTFRWLIENYPTELWDKANHWAFMHSENKITEVTSLMRVAEMKDIGLFSKALDLGFDPTTGSEHYQSTLYFLVKFPHFESIEMMNTLLAKVLPDVRKELLAKYVLIETMMSQQTHKLEVLLPYYDCLSIVISQNDVELPLSDIFLNYCYRISQPLLSSLLSKFSLEDLKKTHNGKTLLGKVLDPKNTAVAESKRVIVLTFLISNGFT